MEEVRPFSMIWTPMKRPGLEIAAYPPGIFDERFTRDDI
jgi:hypothetical protein